jgi:hypothetical protein
MNQKKRVGLVVIILVILVGIVLGIDYVQRQRIASQAPADLPPGSIPIFVDGAYFASFTPEDLDRLEGTSFVDAEEGKTQEGWLLRDVLFLYLEEGDLKVESKIEVSSTSREKSQTLTWDEVDDLENMVLFDLSGRGTLKLVSKIPGFDIRDAWVQDVDQIEISNP